MPETTPHTDASDAPEKRDIYGLYDMLPDGGESRYRLVEPGHEEAGRLGVSRHQTCHIMWAGVRAGRWPRPG